MERKYWDECVRFHGHECPGLTIGYKAALYAKELIGSDFSEDEEIVCISENDACGVDAIQVILGCTAGKGNLLFHLVGKSAYTFFNRKNGKAVRLVLKNGINEGMERSELMDYLHGLEGSEMFLVKEPIKTVPEEARIFNSYTCEKCGEKTGEKWIRLENGKKLCPDCHKEYSRFNV